MDEMFRGGVYGREQLASALTQFWQQSAPQTSWGEVVNKEIPIRGGLVGSWSAPGDPLAEILIVRDEDFQDTISWLNSFFAGISPITQWCRIVGQSDARRIQLRPSKVSLGGSLGAWVGAVLAECSVQAGSIQNLREVTGSAALSTATFAAGRACAVWSRDVDLPEIAKRHDDLSLALRENGRRINADAILPLWLMLSGNSDSSLEEDGTFAVLRELVSLATDSSPDVEPSDLVVHLAERTRDHFDLAEFTDCARGPQLERVRALDRLGDRLAAIAYSPVSEALLGLASSFIEPGTSVSPELLKKYAQKLPLAPLWQGAFSGAVSPSKVFTDQAGLGRLISKAMIADDDLAGRPACDIAYSELSRWVSPSRPSKLELRGMSNRSLSVELVPGVTCSFPLGRGEPANVQNTARTVQPRYGSSTPSKATSRSLQEMDALVSTLQDRIERLEARDQPQQKSLDLADESDTRPRKGGRANPKKSTSR